MSQREHHNSPPSESVYRHPPELSAAFHCPPNCSTWVGMNKAAERSRRCRRLPARRPPLLGVQIPLCSLVFSSSRHPGDQCYMVFRDSCFHFCSLGFVRIEDKTHTLLILLHRTEGGQCQQNGLQAWGWASHFCPKVRPPRAQCP